MDDLLLAASPEAQDCSMIGYVWEPTLRGMNPQPWVLTNLETVYWALDNYGHPQRHDLCIPIIVQGFAAVEKVLPVFKKGMCLWVRGSYCRLEILTAKDRGGLALQVGSISVIGKRKNHGQP